MLCLLLPSLFKLDKGSRRASQWAFTVIYEERKKHRRYTARTHRDGSKVEQQPANEIRGLVVTKNYMLTIFTADLTIENLWFLKQVIMETT
jgi:hypothetical protein